MQGRGGTGPSPGHCSPCLALAETPGPSGRQKGPPRWPLPGKHHCSMETVLRQVGSRSRSPHGGPWGSPAEAHRKPRGTKLGSAARAQVRRLDTRRKTAGGSLAVAPWTPSVTPWSLRSPRSQGQRRRAWKQHGETPGRPPVSPTLPLDQAKPETHTRSHESAGSRGGSGRALELTS